MCGTEDIPSEARNRRSRKMNTFAINGQKVDDDTAIEFKANPKRVGKKAWTRYEEYQKSTTIGEYMEITKEDWMIKYRLADLRYDLDHKFLVIVEETTEE